MNMLTQLIDQELMRDQPFFFEFLKSPFFGVLAGIEAAFTEFRWYVALPLCVVFVPAFSFLTSGLACLELARRIFGSKEHRDLDCGIFSYLQLPFKFVYFCCFALSETLHAVLPFAERPYTPLPA